MKTLALIIGLSLIGSVFSYSQLTATTNTLTQATFNTTLTKVLDNTGTAANATDAIWQTAVQTAFGPGSDNTTMWLWGMLVSANSIATWARKLNATDIALGAHTNEDAVISGVTDYTQTTSVASNAVRYLTPVYGVGTASLGVAVVLGNAATIAASTADYLVLYVVGATSVSSKTIATSSASTTTGSTTTTTLVYSFAVNWVWFEDSVYYILYEAQTSSTVSSTTTISISGIYIQGYNPTTSTLWYSSGAMPVTTAVTQTAASGTLGVPLTAGRAQSANLTTSTNVYVTYMDVASSLNVIKGAVLNKTTGSIVTAAYAIATSTSSPVVTYTVGGIFSFSNTSSNNQTAFGFFVGQYTGSTTSYALQNYYNTLTTAGTAVITVPTTGVSGAPTATGFLYSNGFGVVAKYATSSGYTVVTNTLFNNGSANTTVANTNDAAYGQQTVGTFASTSYFNCFNDAMGALWCGYSAKDSGSDLVYAAVARLYGQLNPYTGTTFGSVLSAVSIVLSFVFTTIFML